MILAAATNFALHDPVTAMNAHFSKDVLRQDLESLAESLKADAAGENGLTDAAGRAIWAEARFETDYTVQYEAHLAHLAQRPAA